MTVQPEGSESAMTAEAASLLSEQIRSLTFELTVEDHAQPAFASVGAILAEATWRDFLRLMAAQAALASDPSVDLSAPAPSIYERLLMSYPHGSAGEDDWQPESSVCCHVCAGEHACDAKAVTSIRHRLPSGGMRTLPLCRPCADAEMA